MVYCVVEKYELLLAIRANIGKPPIEIAPPKVISIGVIYGGLEAVYDTALPRIFYFCPGPVGGYDILPTCHVNFAINCRICD